MSRLAWAGLVLMTAVNVATVVATRHYSQNASQEFAVNAALMADAAGVIAGSGREINGNLLKLEEMN